MKEQPSIPLLLLLLPLLLLAEIGIIVKYHTDAFRLPYILLFLLILNLLIIFLIIYRIAYEEEMFQR